MVFYRKYRPQKIGDLDSREVREKLLSVLSAEPPHAFLFTGPKGLGKTSTARIIAKTVNCEKRSSTKKQIEPCNTCVQCESITNGTNMDVFEIDAASNRGIDEIRDLKEKIWLTPLSARKKVYIIDEVHMLTTEAFNALLKTLEEPPAHAMFILCTTEPHKVPATILSRCFHIRFNPASGDEIVRSLKRIVKNEKIKITDDALYSIAKSAEGGFRDAAKILEELTLLSKDQDITKELFEKLFRTSTIPLKIADLLTSLKERDPKSGLQTITQLTAEGIDLKFFISETLKDLHEMLLRKVGVSNPENDTVQPDPDFGIDEIKRLSELFSQAYADMKFAVLPELPLELAVIEFTSSPSGLADSPHTPVALSAKTAVSDETVTVDSLRKQAGDISKIKALYGDQSKKSVGDTPEKTQAVAGVELLKVPANGDMTPEWLAAFWKSIITEMKQHNHTVAGVLRSCVLKSYDRKVLIIQTSFNFHKERLDDNKARLALSRVCKNLTGNEVKIEVQLKKE